MMVSTQRFQQEIRSRLELASAQGGQDLTIECGELYRSVSRLPVSNRGMIFCCNAMRAEMTIPDEVIFDHVKETLLKVKYKLPRKSAKPLFVRTSE
jgi:hypothetical protein